MWADDADEDIAARNRLLDRLPEVSAGVDVLNVHEDAAVAE